MNKWWRDTSMDVILFVNLVGTFVHTVSCYHCCSPLLGVELHAELNSIVGNHCICWKLAIKNGNCSLWMGKGLQELRLFSRHWCMPANRDTSWLKWSINGSRQTNEILLEKAAFHFRRHLYWARSVLNILWLFRQLLSCFWFLGGFGK